MKQISEKELEVRVAALAAMSPFELREEWARVWGTRCYMLPPRFGTQS